jgi:hypothetical protein
MAENSKARQEDFGRALAEMNNKLAALRSQIASLEQEQASRALHESPAALTSDQEAGAPALTRQEGVQLHSSGDSEAYWAFHKAQEQTRNHLSRRRATTFERPPDPSARGFKRAAPNYYGLLILIHIKKAGPKGGPAHLTARLRKILGRIFKGIAVGHEGRCPTVDRLQELQQGGRTGQILDLSPTR